MSKKVIWSVIILFAIVLAGLAYLKGEKEDDWICSQGQWVKHGNPSSPMPTLPCVK